jgi:hypothetical protein
MPQFFMAIGMDRQNLLLTVSDVALRQINMATQGLEPWTPKASFLQSISIQ